MWGGFMWLLLTGTVGIGVQRLRVKLGRHKDERQIDSYEGIELARQLNLLVIIIL